MTTRNIDRRRNLRESLHALKWYEWLMAGIMLIIAAKSMIDGFTAREAGGNPAWLTVVNFISVIAGIFCVFLCAKASVSNYAFGLINTVAYIVYLAYWHIWGTMALELVLYLPMGVIGWIHWGKHRDEDRPENTRARKLTVPLCCLSAAAVAVLTAGAYAVLDRLGGEAVLTDAATVAIGVVATVLQAMRFREQYAWWLITDVVAVAMYIQHFDPVYLTKKSIYLIVAVIGLVNWFRLSGKNGENT